MSGHTAPSKRTYFALTEYTSVPPFSVLRATTWVHTSAISGTQSRLGELGHKVTVICPTILHVTVPVTRCMHVFVWPPSGQLPTDSWVLLSAQGCILYTGGSDNTDRVCKQG